MKTPQVRLAELVNKIPGCKQPWDAIPPGIFLISFPPPGSENVLLLTLRNRSPRLVRGYGDLFQPSLVPSDER